MILRQSDAFVPTVRGVDIESSPVKISPGPAGHGERSHPLNDADPPSSAHGPPCICTLSAAILTLHY